MGDMRAELERVHRTVVEGSTALPAARQRLDEIAPSSPAGEEASITQVLSPAKVAGPESVSVETPATEAPTVPAAKIPSSPPVEEEASSRRDDRPAGPAGPPRVDTPPSPQATPHERALALVQAAHGHLDRGEVDAAAECAKKVAELVPDLPEGHALRERLRASATQRYQQKRASAAPPTSAVRESVRYLELGHLGDGPSGSVYLAYDRYLSQLAALKVIPPGSTLDRGRFERSAYQWMALREHANVVNLYDVATHEGSPCIVMEYLDGKTLDRILGERPYMPLTEKASLVVQLCDAVAFLHANAIIHRDIRPSSIIVMTSGQVKLLESGIARSALPEDPEVSRTLFLIDDYRAPELTRGRPEQRSDIFSVGAVLFELLTYRQLPPNAAESEIVERLVSAHPAIPKDIIAIVRRALKWDPGERFSTAGEMRGELARYLHLSPRVLFALHGIRTHWAWQRALTEVAEASRWRCRTDHWSFGYFSLIRFLLPGQRKTKIEWFRRTYESEVRNRDVGLTEGTFPSIVCHSFGTYILGNALLAYSNIRFDKVILCGSILPCDFPWDALIERGQVQAVRNEYGVRDMWTRTVNWFVRGTGPSGRQKFTREHDRLEQEEFFYDHSEYFEKGHIRQKWFAFLERQWPEISESTTRIARPTTRTPLGLYLAYGVLLLGLGWLLLILFGARPHSV
jgi:serine/threonine-protein kinase